MNTELFWLRLIPQLPWFIGVLIPQTFLIHMGWVLLIHMGWVLSWFTWESKKLQDEFSLDSHVNLLIHMGWVLLIHMGWVLYWFTCQSLDSHGMSSLLIHMSISWFTWDEFSLDSHVDQQSLWPGESKKSQTSETLTSLKCAQGSFAVYIGLFEVCVWLFAVCIGLFGVYVGLMTSETLTFKPCTHARDTPPLLSPSPPTPVNRLWGGYG